jgi:hypothetical protein
MHTQTLREQTWRWKVSILCQKISTYYTYGWRRCLSSLLLAQSYRLEVVTSVYWVRPIATMTRSHWDRQHLGTSTRDLCHEISFRTFSLSRRFVLTISNWGLHYRIVYSVPHLNDLIQGEDGPALRALYLHTVVFITIQRKPSGCKRNLPVCSGIFFRRIQAPFRFFTACHKGLDEMFFHHLYSIVRNPRVGPWQPNLDQRYRLSLDIWTLLRTPQSEILKDNGAMWQME